MKTKSDNTPAATVGHTPTIKDLYRRTLNKYFMVGADEYKENASDSSVKRHYDEYMEKERELLAAIERQENWHAELVAALEAADRVLTAYQGSIDRDLKQDEGTFRGLNESWKQVRAALAKLETP